MARRKTITKDMILNAAYEVVATEGFSRFTARNIASKMKCSTQPIYLEFKNMGDLRSALFDKLYTYLSEEIFPVAHTGDPLIDLPLNYIYFARDHNRLYRSLFIEDYGGGEEMHSFGYSQFLASARRSPIYSELSEDKLMALHTATWIVATGIASLMSSGIIRPTEADIIQMLQNTIDNTLKEDALVATSF